MAGWHHWLDGRESEWTPGAGDGQGGLACCNSWGRKERLYWTELILISNILILGFPSGSVGERNGNPLQCSCLENPRDEGAWWAAICGVAQSQTRLSDLQGFPDSSVGKESACNAGDPGLSPGSGRSTGEGIGYLLQYSWASLVAQLVNNRPALGETWIRSLGWENPLEKGRGTYSSILAWRIPCIVAKSWTRLSDFHFQWIYYCYF